MSNTNFQMIMTQVLGFSSLIEVTLLIFSPSSNYFIFSTWTSWTKLPTPIPVNQICQVGKQQSQDLMLDYQFIVAKFRTQQLSEHRPANTKSFSHISRCSSNFLRISYSQDQLCALISLMGKQCIIS